MITFPNAKINLGLYVERKREDGYHDLSTVFYPIPLTDAVEVFLKKQPHLTVRRHGDTLVASTDFGRERRVILAGHLDTVPVIDNFPPKWLQPGDPLIREDVAAGHEH